MKNVDKFLIFIALLLLSKPVYATTWAFSEVRLFDYVQGVCDSSKCATDFVINLPSECVVTSCTCLSELLSSGNITCSDADSSAPLSIEGSIGGVGNLTGVSMNGVKDAVNAAYNTWFDSVGNPTCPDGLLLGAMASGYISHESTNIDPSKVDVQTAYYKRADCSKFTNRTGLRPISSLFAGGGVSSMQETNSLLTDIKTNTTAFKNFSVHVSGSGGGSTDMTTTNNLLTDTKGFLSGISNALTGPSTLASAPATAPRTAYKSQTVEDIDLFMAADYRTAFTSFQTSAQNTAVFKLIDGFFGGVPHDGSSVVSFNGGVFGSHTFDFATWATFMAVLKGIILVMFSAASVRIVILKG